MYVKELKQHLRKFPEDYGVCVLFGLPMYIFDLRVQEDISDVYDLCCNSYEDYEWDCEHNQLEYYDTVQKLLDKLDEVGDDKTLMMYDDGICSSLSEVSDRVTNEKGELIRDTVFIIPLIHMIG